MAETDATMILLDHIQEVLTAFKEAGGDTRKSYDTLTGSIAAIGAMPWNTFRTRFPVVVAAWEAGHAHRSDKVRDLEREVARLRDELAVLRSDIGKIKSGQIVADTEVPKTLEGWSLNQHKRGFWRAFRKVQGKSRCIYVGTKFDPVAAREKLVSVNAELLANAKPNR